MRPASHLGSVVMKQTIRHKKLLVPIQQEPATNLVKGGVDKSGIFYPHFVDVSCIEARTLHQAVHAIHRGLVNFDVLKAFNPASSAAVQEAVLPFVIYLRNVYKLTPHQVDIR